MRNAVKWLVAPLLVLSFLAAVVWIVMTPLQSGDAYPSYSTLRADPLGAKILYDSLAELPGIQVERNFKLLGRLEETVPGTLFYLGGSGPGFYSEAEGQLKQWERLASKGWRIVFVFQNAMPAIAGNFDVFTAKQAPKGDSAKAAPMPTVRSRWGMHLRLRTATIKERSEMERTPRKSSLYFEGDESWTVRAKEDDGKAAHVEKPMGKGSIALVARIFPLSNEGLRERPDGKLISQLTGPNQRIVFDELHHGLDETGSVGSLIRRYNMEATVGMLFLLGLLFIWRNASSLLPLKDSATESKELLGRDNRQGMLTLLRRSIPREQLISTCLSEWERALPLLPLTRREVPLRGAHDESVTAGYRRIHQLLTERK
jgi:hypothetical protein